MPRIPNNLTPAELKKLQKQWYAKAAASGFKDIETDDDVPLLKEWDSMRFQKGHDYKDNTVHHQVESRFLDFESTQRYYELAGHLLHSHRFESATHKRIWELHSEGKTVREILVSIRRMKPTYKSLSSVHEVIRRLAELLRTDEVR
jgi:hypothetical protein